MLRLELEPGVTIHVVDARSGEELEDVSLYMSHGTEERFRDTYLSPPACFVTESNRILGDSPLALPAMLGTFTGWATAPGYQWRRFAFDGESSSVKVALAEGADLIVELRGASGGSPDAALLVHGYGPGEERPWQAPLATERIRGRPSVSFEGLPPGNVLVVAAASEGVDFIGPRIGQRRVRLAAGERTEVVLDLGDPALRAELATLELSVPRELLAGGRQAWDTLIVELRDGGEFGGAGRALTEILPGDRKEETLLVRKRGLPPGEYCVTLQRAGLAEEVVLHPGEVATVALEAREPSRVEVLVVGPSGAPLKDVELKVRPAASRSGAAWTSVGTTDAAGAMAFEWPAGPVELLPLGSRYPPRMHRCVLAAGTHRERVRLDEPRSGGELRVSVVSEGEEVLLPMSFWHAIVLREADGSRAQLLSHTLVGGEQRGWLPGGWSARGAVLRAAAPGEYELHLPALPPDPALPPLRVTLEEGRSATLVVDG